MMKPKHAILMIVIACAAAMILRLQAAEPAPPPPAALGLPANAKPAISFEYKKGANDPSTMTVYDEFGPVATLHPDGTVVLHKGTSDQAAQLFFTVITHRLRNCGKP